MRTNLQVYCLDQIVAWNASEIRFSPNISVSTPTDLWAYAASVPPRRTELAEISKQLGLQIKVRLRVVLGRIRVGCVTAEGNRFLAEQERGPEDGEVEFILEIKRPLECGDLIIRNASRNGESSSVILYSVQTDEAPLKPGTGDLLEDQLAIVGTDAQIIFDVGTHHGHSALDYLTIFPKAQIFAFEPDPGNFARAHKKLGELRSRCTLRQAAIAEHSGKTKLHVNSRDGTHSLLPLGETRFFASPIQSVGLVEVEALVLDEFVDANGIGKIDIFKMDIQGGELAALHGARRLLEQHRIGLMVLEVEFKKMYLGQPLFWEIGAFVDQFGYALFGLYDEHFDETNPLILSWADAIFLSPEYLSVEAKES